MFQLFIWILVVFETDGKFRSNQISNSRRRYEDTGKALYYNANTVMIPPPIYKNGSSDRRSLSQQDKIAQFKSVEKALLDDKNIGIKIVTNIPSSFASTDNDDNINKVKETKEVNNNKDSMHITIAPLILNEHDVQNTARNENFMIKGTQINTSSNVNPKYNNKIKKFQLTDKNIANINFTAKDDLLHYLRSKNLTVGNHKFHSLNGDNNNYTKVHLISGILSNITSKNFLNYNNKHAQDTIPINFQKTLNNKEPLQKVIRDSGRIQKTLKNYTANGRDFNSSKYILRNCTRKEFKNNNNKANQSIGKESLLACEDTVNAEKKAVEELMVNSVETIGGIAKQMKEAGTLRGETLKVETRLDKAKITAAKFTSPEALEKGGKSFQVFESAGAGLVTIVKGIQAGSWTDIVSGGLAVLATIAAFAGPIGALISVGLTLFSAIFGMFGGATGGEESTEGMIKRVLDDALVNQKAEELRAASSGLRKVYGSLSKSVANLRRSDKVERGQAVEFYNQAFVGIKLFGILEFYINKWCDIGDASKYSTPEEKIDLNKNATRCLEFVNLYCDLSILRQLLVADMASFLVEKDLETTAKNLLGLVTQEQRSDSKFLSFIFDPINNKKQRFVAAKYLSVMDKYTTITSYLQKLDDISLMEGETDMTLFRRQEDTVSTPRKLLKEFVMYCSDAQLKKDCFENTELATYVGELDEDLDGWAKSIQSFYISNNRVVIGFNEKDFRGTIIGPLYGPGVYSIYDSVLEIKSLIIQTSPTLTATNMVKVCDKENLDMEGECTTFKKGREKTLNKDDKSKISTYGGDTTGDEICTFPFFYGSVEYTDECAYHGSEYRWCAIEVDDSKEYTKWGKCILGTNWNDRIESLSIPPGLMVTGYADEDFKGQSYGPYYGPDTISKLSSPNKWKSLIVGETQWKTSDMIKICQEENLAGFCDHLVPPEALETLQDYKQITKIHGTSWNLKNSKIKSMKIPGGIEVHLYSRIPWEGQQFGPYTGPITVNSIDGTKNTDDIIHSIKIIRIY